MNKALCRLRPHSDDMTLVMDEPMVVEAMEGDLKASDKNSEFSVYLNLSSST